MSVLAITGTGTGVGKTITTAALAGAAAALGIDVAVCKPVQTGTITGDDDLAEIGRLTGTTALHGVARYPQPLAPVAAAAEAGQPLPSGAELIAAITAVDRPGRLTLVEGAGGLLVPIAADGVTLRDLAVQLRAPVLVVCGAELGTLNYTALTLEALANRGLDCAGLVIGSYPDAPGAVETGNRAALAELAPLRAVLPAGAGAADAARFAELTGAAIPADWVRALAG